MVAVVLLGLTIALLGLVAASARVIGWLLAAATMAGLLHPLVAALRRRMPRPLALALVVVTVLAVAGFIAYRVVDDVNAQLKDLQDALPDATRDIERSERFGELATEARLAERVEAFVEELPERLRGGEPAEALRSAATRGVAFLATGVLTIFFLIHGPRLLASAAKQLPSRRQDRVRAVAAAAYGRSWRYVTGSIGMAVIAGLLAYACVIAIDLPGAAPLAVWMGLVDLVPVVGVVLGAVPIILLAAATSPAPHTALVAVVLLGWQIVEILVLQKRVERLSVHVGPFVTIAVGMVGLELYGIGGALMALVVAVLVVTSADEAFGLGPEAVAAPPVTSDA